jgi:dipeptidyl aminopeptidase/acylaminoacyl peptidase
MMRHALAAAGILLVGSTLAAEPRPLKVDDIFALKTVADPRVSPEGGWVAFTVSSMDPKQDSRDTDVWMVPFAGGPAIRLTTSPKPETRPRFSPDGRYLAFLSGRDGETTQVYLLDRRGGEAVKLTDFKGSVSDLVWSPDGKRLALVVSDPDPDEVAAKPDDKDEQKDKEKKAQKPIVIRRLQFKRDGEGYLGEQRQHVYAFDVAAKTSIQLTSGQYDDSQPAFSPDGQWIAFVSNRTPEPDSNNNTDIFVVPSGTAGTAPRALTRSPGHDDEPAWSSDGQTLVYVAGGDPKDFWYATNHVALVALAGGPERALTAELDRNVARPRFASDGRSVLFLLEEGGNDHLASVPVAGGSVTRLVDAERDVSGYDLGPKGQIAVLESQQSYPDEISALEPGGGLRRLTTVNDEFLKGITLGKVQRFKVKSADGTPVDGFLTLPPNVAPGVKLPTILRIHGGPVSQYTTGFNLEWQLFAAHGFAVVSANPRGSSGYGRAFSRALWADWGNPDFQDVMAAVDHVVAMGVADPERLGVGGWSYGGILTDYVITKSTRFKAAISGASEANYLANYGTDHYQREWETELGLPWRNTALWIRLSPWFNVEKVTTPTLIMCGQLDMNVPLLNSEQLYQALRRINKVETELVIYPGEHHGFRRPSHIKDRFDRYLAWYGRLLKGEPTPASPAKAPAS